MKWINFFILDGKLTKKGKNIFTVIGLAAAYGVWYFIGDMSDIRFWLCVIIGIVFGYGTVWAGWMEKWGYKPFTNDPLGWRKAKASYRNKESAEDSAKETSEPIDDDKPK